MYSLRVDSKIVDKLKRHLQNSSHSHPVSTGWVRDETHPNRFNGFPENKEETVETVKTGLGEPLPPG
jgi:hypothetical protein